MLSKEIQKQVYTRDGWKCRHCNNRNGLHPHHLIYKSHGGPDDLNNLLTLCWKCHSAHHDGFLKIYVIGLTIDNIVVKFKRMKGWRP